ncbi:MAG: hypothetical protein HYX41_05770 [Bdellovibrio sp.]|nr:hypothetical protein [Bdellovibrio sp.]
MKKILWIWVISGLVFCACTRSPAFRREDDFGPESSAGSATGGSGSAYYNRSEGGHNDPVSLKKRVVILDFWNDSPSKQFNFGGYLADELKRNLSLTQKVVLPDQEIRSGMVTEDFLQGDKVRVAQLMVEGRRLGVALVVIGKITKITFRQKGDDVGLLRSKKSTAAIEVEAKFFDVQGGREIMAVTRRGNALVSNLIATDESGVEDSPFRIELIQSALRETAPDLTQDILRSLDKINWQGRIAKAIGPKIYISAGKASGLVKGDILKVMTSGEDIFDPLSNAYLGRSQGKLKGTLEIVDFMGLDGAVTETHTGGGFKEGDIVELY